MGSASSRDPGTARFGVEGEGGDGGPSGWETGPGPNRPALSPPPPPAEPRVAVRWQTWGVRREDGVGNRAGKFSRRQRGERGRERPHPQRGVSRGHAAPTPCPVWGRTVTAAPATARRCVTPPAAERRRRGTKLRSRCQPEPPPPPHPGLGQLRSGEPRSSQRSSAQVSVLHSPAPSCKALCCGVGGTERPGVTAGNRGMQRRKCSQQRGCGHAEPGDAGWGCILGACVCKTCRERRWERGLAGNRNWGSWTSPAASTPCQRNGSGFSKRVLYLERIDTRHAFPAPGTRAGDVDPNPLQLGHDGAKTSASCPRGRAGSLREVLGKSCAIWPVLGRHGAGYALMSKGEGRKQRARVEKTQFAT